MSTSSNAVPSPAPDAGSPDNAHPPAAPVLTVVPAPETNPASPRSVWNLEQLRELGVARNVITAAQKPARVDPLKTRKIEPAFVTQLADDIIAAGELNSTVLASNVDGQKTTRKNAQCARKLVRSLRRIQTAARQEYKHSDPLKLKEYLIGEDIVTSRFVLEQSSLTLLALAGTERPAGLDTAFLDRVTAERAGYVACGVAQPGETSEAQQERLSRQDLIDSIKERRQKIQLAAEFLWPAEDPANAPTRREFDLPPIRPYLS